MAVAKPVVKPTQEQHNNEPPTPVATPMEEGVKVYYRLTNKGDLEITDTKTVLVITRDQFHILHGMLFGNQQMHGYPPGPLGQFPFGPAYSPIPPGAQSPHNPFGPAKR